MSTEKKWEELTLDEKLTELGFGKDTVYDQPVVGPTLTVTEVRMHAALDQLMDVGGLLGEIEAMVEPVATSDIPTGDELNICISIYKLITVEEE